MNGLNANVMSTKERLTELYAILARGIIRLRMRVADISASEEALRLHFTPDQSGVANSPIRRTA